jgi:hypothetical protein
MNADRIDQAQTKIHGMTAQFLRLCLQERWDSPALDAARSISAHDKVDWDALLRLAGREGIAPLLYHATRGRLTLPERVSRQLRQDYFETAQRNVRLFHELEHVLHRLTQDNVPVILLKGAALAGAVYGNVAVRPMSDIDLLVRETDVPLAIHALTSMGYTVVPPRAYRCEVTLRSESRQFAPIELHWSLFVPFYYQHMLSEDWLWETALPVQVGDARTHILGPQAQLLHLSGHLALHHGSAGTMRGLWLYDLAAVIAGYREKLDWETLLRQAQTYGLVLSLQTVLPRVSDAWQAPIPPYVLEQLDTLQPPPSEERAVAALTSPNRPASQSFISELAALPGHGPRLRCLWRNLFPPPGYLEQIYGVPTRLLVPFAYPYRWLRALFSLLGR